MRSSPPARPPKAFVGLLDLERPVQVIGVTNAYVAMLAEAAGFEALYLSGSGVATSCFGLPDLALTSLTEVAEEVRRITAASSRPLLVDADTGWGSPVMVERAGRELRRAGAAAIQIEDQVMEKRCGHRPNKRLVPIGEMQARIDALRQGAGDDVAIVARTDAIAVDGCDAAIDRAGRFESAGADCVFVEAPTDLGDYAAVAAATALPVLANMTEFGVTPLYSLDELASANVSYVLYPLSLFRMMSAAAAAGLAAIRADGHQRRLLATMQTRAQLYDVLDYHRWESRIDDYARVVDGSAPTPADRRSSSDLFVPEELGGGERADESGRADGGHDGGESDERDR